MGIDRRILRMREGINSRKRNQEHHTLQYWQDTDKYYRAWNVRASKYNIWASQPQSPISSEKEKEAEKENLKLRRAKLIALLNDEQNQLEQEMKEYLRAQKLKEEIDSVDEDDGRHVMTSTEDYDQIKSHPVIQTIEKKRNQDRMKKSWMEQMREKQLKEEYEKEMQEKLEQENEKQRQIDEEREKELARKREKEIQQLKNYLLNQMQEVKKKDELTRQLKLQERQEMELKTELDRISIQRQQIEMERKKRDLCSFLRHQYQLQLKNRTRQVQEQLEEDKRLISEISRCLEQQETENNRVREQARKEVDRANRILTEYSQLEKQREREMEFMFFEEAKKMWQKQELLWNAEQEARNNLLRDVLITIQKQVREKLQENTERHKGLANEKEELLKRIEEINNQLKDAELDATRKKKAYMSDLQKQIQEKEQEKAKEEEEKQREFLEHQAKLVQEQERILQELKKMNIPSSPVTGKIANLWR